MIDIVGLPQPKDAPEPGSCARVERPEDGLCVIVLDPPHRDATVLDLPLLRDLGLALDEVDRAIGTKGLVITGRSPLHFAFGADIDAIESVSDPEVVKRVVYIAHALFDRIESMRDIRTVAAVGGPVPGGALELSLACDLIVAADDPKTRIGLPETQLGILPGWGGTHRLPLRIGPIAALTPILQGRLLRARQAKKLGIVDRLTKKEYLLRVASDAALGRAGLKRRGRGLQGWLVDRNPAVMAFVGKQARAKVMAQTKGHYPAVLAALDMVLQAPRTRRHDRARKEAEALTTLVTGPVCKSLVSIFRASEAAKKLGVGPAGEKPAPLERGAVVGAGVMGGAIASLMAERGIYTRLSDLSPEALDASLLEHRREIDTKQKKRRLERHEADAAYDRLDPTQGTVGLGRVEIVIEAVAERMDIKRSVFGEIADEVPDDCILATNTSSLSVDEIAEGVPSPERFVGLHFFNPVRKMPLVEIVRGSRTSDDTVRRTAALALRLGKTPVIVKDVAGFLVNRLLGPYLDESLRLFELGVDPERLDRLMEEFGMPMGPLRLLDEVGFDIASHAAESLAEAYGSRMHPTRVLQGFIDENRLGKKTGRGFYHYVEGKKGKHPTLETDLARLQTTDHLSHLADEDVVDRCVLSMVNEAARCLEEGVVASAAELDLATVFGTGFAPFRGGLTRYADSLGTRDVAERLKRIAAMDDVHERMGGPEKFTPADLVTRLAEDGLGFHSPREVGSTESSGPERLTTSA